MHSSARVDHCTRGLENDLSSILYTTHRCTLYNHKYIITLPYCHNNIEIVYTIECIILSTQTHKTYYYIANFIISRGVSPFWIWFLHIVWHTCIFIYYLVFAYNNLDNIVINYRLSWGGRAFSQLRDLSTHHERSTYLLYVCTYTGIYLHTFIHIRV